MVAIGITSFIRCPYKSLIFGLDWIVSLFSIFWNSLHLSVLRVTNNFLNPTTFLYLINVF